MPETAPPFAIPGFEPGDRRIAQLRLGKVRMRTAATEVEIVRATMTYVAVTILSNGKPCILGWNAFPEITEMQAVAPEFEDALELPE